jgi:hypothetical protein
MPLFVKDNTTSAVTATVATSETTTSATYVDLTTTTDSVTLNVPSSGMVLVALYAALTNSAANYSNVGFALSGANTVAAADTMALSFNGTSFLVASAVFQLTGLTPGSTTFKMKYDVTSGTGTFKNRRISVTPL